MPANVAQLESGASPPVTNLIAFPGSSGNHRYALCHCPQGWILPVTVAGGPPTSPPLEATSGKIQERDLCAITVRIRARSHSVPAVWMDGGCVDAGYILVIAVRGPSQASSSIQVDPGTFTLVFS